MWFTFAISKAYSPGAARVAPGVRAAAVVAWVSVIALSFSGGVFQIFWSFEFVWACLINGRGLIGLFASVEAVGEGRRVRLRLRRRAQVGQCHGAAPICRVLWARGGTPRHRGTDG